MEDQKSRLDCWWLWGRRWLKTFFIQLLCFTITVYFSGRDIHNQSWCRTVYIELVNVKMWHRRQFTELWSDSQSGNNGQVVFIVWDKKFRSIQEHWKALQVLKSRGDGFLALADRSSFSFVAVQVSFNLWKLVLWGQKSVNKVLLASNFALVWQNNKAICSTQVYIQNNY